MRVVARGQARRPSMLAAMNAPAPAVAGACRPRFRWLAIPALSSRRWSVPPISRAEPGAPPFVSVGDAVRVGDTLLIIEAMKVMNPIKAPQNGVLKQILISDGQPVEYGEPMMIVE